MKLKLKKKIFNRADRYQTSGGSVRFHKYDGTRDKPLEAKPKDVPDEIKRQVLFSGSGFVGSLKRIYYLVEEYSAGERTAEECIKILAKEFGYGGSYGPLDEDMKSFKMYGLDYRSTKGLRFSYFVPNKGYYECKLSMKQYLVWAVNFAEAIKEYAMENGRWD